MEACFGAHHLDRKLSAAPIENVHAEIGVRVRLLVGCRGQKVPVNRKNGPQ
jgi:hypothetical protein